IDIFDTKEEVPHVSATVDNAKIADNDYNLSVSSYVEAKDTREEIDIKILNEEIARTVDKINQLRTEIDIIIKEIEL
ncbi:N-6 DNA methylase, partial [Escherichia coli]|nr:N-6 DNA methylase [Escherichia coli]